MQAGARRGGPGARGAVLRCCMLLAAVLAGGRPGALPAAEDELAAQRERYREAQRALGAGSLQAFETLAAELRDYPLYPYLLYDYYRPRLARIENAQLAQFLENFGDIPAAGDLRRAWLRLLAQRGRWQDFLEHYRPQRDPVLQCMQLQARLRSGNDSYLLEDARSLWLSGESLPPQCDPAFERLYRSELLTSAVIWERIGLALERGNTGLAGYVGRRLPAAERPWLERWIAAHNQPAQALRDAHWEDTALARRIVLHGMRRLARQNVDQAVAAWRRLQPAYAFGAAERAAIDRLLAVRAAATRNARAAELLDAVANDHVDEEVMQWRVRSALNSGDWPALLRWTEGNPPRDEATRGLWLYWRARALEETGAAEQANAAFQLAARERNYYGFIAADRAGLAYDLNHHPLPEDFETWQRIAGQPAIRRAHELYLLGMTQSARREWQHALESMTSYQMQIAALIAAGWGWHDRVILTMGRAGAYDDLILRFPVPYEEQLRAYSERRRLDLAWVFALVRAESAFMEDARSPAGALGLMQVMPATGTETARSIGLRPFTPDRLTQAEVNVPIGTAYLRQMLDRFDGNMVLATAAYNAGPGSVSRWVRRGECVEPDVWIERIPILETRKYVQRILYYASIYDWRLQREVQPVRLRMAAVQPGRQAVAAAHGCPVQDVVLR